MLRIHFSSKDLANTRIAAGPDPLWELSLSSHQLQLRGANPLLDRWRRQVAGVLRPGRPLREQVSLALEVSPPRGYFPDFLTPFEAIEGFEAGLDAVLRTPDKRLRREIGLLNVADRRQVSAIDDLRRGDTSAVAALGEALRSYHSAAIAPVWEHISAAVEIDRARRIGHLSGGGWQHLFNNLHPAAKFTGGVLEISCWGSKNDRDLDLADRGLLIIPSYFKEQRQLMVLADSDLPPVLLYPIDLSARLASATGHKSLIALIGRTRVQVLEETVSGATTSAIATQAHISLPAASKHLKVLRAAGLVSSTRQQHVIRHTITGLGRNLMSESA
jgi:DNA-binding transcriptional ArsR family regulator